jgi:hypothetical protein
MDLNERLMENIETNIIESDFILLYAQEQGRFVLISASRAPTAESEQLSDFDIISAGIKAEPSDRVSPHRRTYVGSMSRLGCVY